MEPDNDKDRDESDSHIRPSPSQGVNACDVCGLRPTRSTVCNDGVRRTVCPVHGQELQGHNPWPDKNTDRYVEALKQVYVPWHKEPVWFNCTTCGHDFAVTRQNDAYNWGHAMTCPVCRGESIERLKLKAGKLKAEPWGNQGGYYE